MGLLRSGLIVLVVFFCLTYFTFIGYFFLKEARPSIGTRAKECESIEQSLTKINKDLDELQQALSSKKRAQTLELGEEHPTPQPFNSSFFHLGCFKDTYDRDLPKLQKMVMLDPGRCMSQCAAQGFRFAGLQAGSECWCGSTVGRHGAASGCDQPCSGNALFRCGGSFVNDVYLAYELSPPINAFKRIKRSSIKESSVWCDGQTVQDRTCKFKNLYYMPSLNKYFFYKTPASVIAVNGMISFTTSTATNLLDLSTVGALPPFTIEVGETFPESSSIPLIPGKSLLFGRFLPYNIMHSIHDDLLGVYFTLVKYFSTPGESGTPYDLQTRIFLVDDHSAGAYITLVQQFSDLPLIHRKEMEDEPMICFEVAAVGLSKRANWYQYGFGRTQGPIPFKQVSGTDVREVANFILTRMGLPPVKDLRKDSFQQKNICIYSRTRNRLLLNEIELATTLHGNTGMEATFLRLEELTIKEILEKLGSCAISIGMHGSILILNMFLPKNALTIELYPYAVPSENYTPYRTMAHLPGMDLKYVAWENKHRENTVYFKDRPRLLGGISHLSEGEQRKIIDSTTVPTHFCCEDPYWLFKIYQDTKVDEQEIVEIVNKEMSE